MKLLFSLLAAVALTTVASGAAAQCASDADCPPGMGCRGEGSCMPVTGAPAGSAQGTPPQPTTPPAQPPPAAAGAENTAAACKNGLDDDRDGHFDCADQDCGAFVFCAQAPGAPAGGPPALPPTYYPPSGPGGAGDGPPRSGPREKKGIPGLYITGPILWAVAWGSIVIASTLVYKDTREEDTALGLSLIPVAGPFIMIGSTEVDTRELEAPLIVSGVLQGAGIVLTVLGLVIRRPVRSSVALAEHGPVSLTLKPMAVGATGSGLGLAIGGL